MPGRKLKVFEAQFGFFDSVVAAPSQAAALKAWGTHQNLFASGDATVVTDEAVIAAASSHPGIPLRRAVGSTDAFALKPTSLPKAPDAPKAGAAKAVAKSRPAPPPRPPADRSELNAAEKALADLDARRKREEADLRRQEDEVQTRREAAQSAYVKARKAASAKIQEARAAYRNAGGD